MKTVTKVHIEPENAQDQEFAQRCKVIGSPTLSRLTGISTGKLSAWYMGLNFLTLEQYERLLRMVIAMEKVADPSDDS
ncbi:MAG: hypothetical protein JKY67_00015 [Pseudomonadales bacterium]|nr:hypothetical protein [Pseudomonadales bacterium]